MTFFYFDACVARECGIDLEQNDFCTRDSLEAINIVTTRYNKDVVVNNNNKLLIEFCRNFDLKIANGRFGEDCCVGNHTCVADKGSTTIDYFIMSPFLMP